MISNDGGHVSRVPRLRVTLLWGLIVAVLSSVSGADGVVAAQQGRPSSPANEWRKASTGEAPADVSSPRRVTLVGQQDDGGVLLPQISTTP
ncbi:MAG: hypothetical protein KDA85_03675, partial [Planctomycetaceae bacterium]|nr:hypothetical protein [Planctomycetaceae bacterium]